jgi:hypothetical protein
MSIRVSTVYPLLVDRMGEFAKKMARTLSLNVSVTKTALRVKYTPVKQFCNNSLMALVQLQTRCACP